MWRRPTLPGVTPVPSAQQGLTSLFGMGRGGTPALGRLNLDTCSVCNILLFLVHCTSYLVRFLTYIVETVTQHR